MNAKILAILALPLLSIGCAATTSEEESEAPTESASDEVRAARKITSDPKLVATLNALADVASGGASLSFFGWNASPRTPTSGCKAATAAKVKSTFNEMVDTIIDEGDFGEDPDLNPAKLADAKARFAALVGTGSYRICEGSTDGNRSSGTLTTIIGTRGGLRVSFELSWED